jgi:hypothetical protein
MQRRRFLTLLSLSWLPWRSSSARGDAGRLSRAEFENLMRTIAEGWNSGDARKAADCYAVDAIYEEPPKKQYYRGRDALYRFFGGPQKPVPPMQMTWHYLLFDEAQQLGAGEYTFQMNHRYHGLVLVRVTAGKISNWREYQYPSDIGWPQFSAGNPF